MPAASVNTGHGTRFVLHPNRPLSWRQTQLFFAAISATTLVVAGGFAALGFWPVLPFAGLELGLLWLCLWSVARRADITEVVDVLSDKVRVAKGRQRPEQTFECPRAWARAVVLPARVRSHPSKLVLRSHGRQVSVGDFLREEERMALARELRRAIAGALPANRDTHQPAVPGP